MIGELLQRFPGERTQDIPEAIVGMNAESSIPVEGKVTYDIQFYILTPDEKHVKIIMDLAAQLMFNPGYDLMTRGMIFWKYLKNYL